MADCLVVEYIPEGWGVMRNNWFGSCAGQGVCVLGVNDATNETFSYCECDEGWTGRSDFFDFQENCQVSLNAMRIIWAIGFVAYNVNFLLGAPKAFLRFKRFLATKRDYTRLGKTYRIRQNKGFLVNMWAYLVVWPSINALAIIKLVDPDQHLGSSLPLSLAFFFGKLGFYSSVYVFQPALLNSLLQGSKRKTRAELNVLVNKSEAFGLFISAFSILLGALPLVTYATSNGRDGAALIIYSCYMIGMVLALICLATWSIYVRSNIIKVFDESYALIKSDRVLETKKALVNMQDENIRQCVVQGIIFSMFAFFPSFYGVHDYFLPLNVYAYAAVGKKTAFTTITDGNKETKSQTGSFETENESIERGSSRSKGDSFTSFQDTSDMVAPQELEGIGSSIQTLQENVVSFQEEPIFDDEDDDSV